MVQKNERVELEMKIMKARQFAKGADDTTRERLEALATELEQKTPRDRRVRHGRPQPVSPRDFFFDRLIAGGLGSCDHVDLRPPQLAASFSSIVRTAGRDRVRLLHPSAELR